MVEESKFPWVQFLLGLNAALITVQTGVTRLTSLSDDAITAIVFACGIALAFVGPFLPKVSNGIRSALKLQRRGN